MESVDKEALDAQAVRLINELLVEYGGEIPAAAVDERVAEEGISKRALARAKKQLGVKSHRKGGAAGDGYWVWIQELAYV